MRRRREQEAVWTGDALGALLGALFEIRVKLVLIRELLEDGDGPEEAEEPADDS